MLCYCLYFILDADVYVDCRYRYSSKIQSKYSVMENGSIK